MDAHPEAFPTAEYFILRSFSSFPIWKSINDHFSDSKTAEMLHFAQLDRRKTVKPLMQNAFNFSERAIFTNIAPSGKKIMKAKRVLDQ